MRSLQGAATAEQGTKEGREQISVEPVHSMMRFGSGSLPDAFPIPINFPNPVKGYLVEIAVEVVQFKNEMVFSREMERGKGHQDDPVFDPVVISDLKIGIGKILVPLDAVE